MYKGFLCIVLHAHLPYIRHPEHDYFLEENWLFEAITESYIPLVEIFSRLIDEGVDFRVTLSLSPSLVEMLNDTILRKRYLRHIENLIELSEKEVRRTKGDIHFGPVAKMYNKRFKRIRYLFKDYYKEQLISAFAELRGTGKLEIITSTATHAFLPTLSEHPQGIRAQIRIGLDHYKEVFGGTAEGIWLPECGYVPGIDEYLREEGLRFFFLDAHGITQASPVPRFGVHVPALCRLSGIIAFGRDIEASNQVWSSLSGYPGDFDYRDFYRDIGYDISDKHVTSFLEPFGTKTYTGLKYYRITGKTENKEPYVIERAKAKIVGHANDFILKRERQIDCLLQRYGINPVIVVPYDAELFGHWWFEGPDWLYNLLKGIQADNRNFVTVTATEFLHTSARIFQSCQPSASSWGHRGYNEVWLNESNDYVYRHLLKATERMTFLAEMFPRVNNRILQRALNQAARELLLAQQSDWTFMMKSGGASEYGKKRFGEHIAKFNSLYQSIISQNIEEKSLAEIEAKDNIFQRIDYTIFRHAGTESGQELIKRI
ncbi:MAG: 1,4-alpha-glucan branching protein domain-containing protein [Nitrospirota bacterium]